MHSPVPTKLPEQVTKNKGKYGKFSQKFICNILSAIYILSYAMAEGKTYCAQYFRHTWVQSVRTEQDFAAFWC